MLPFADCDLPATTETKSTAIQTLVNSMPLENTPFLAPYVPVNHVVAAEAIKFVQLNSTDIVADLGCGDARILVKAAEIAHSCIAVELDPWLCTYIRENHDDLLQSKKMTLIEADFLSVDLDSLGVTCLILYLLPGALHKLRTLLAEWIVKDERRRIVCITYSIEGWEAIRGMQVEIPPSSSFMGGTNGIAQWLYYYDCNSIKC
jgi:Ribosomal RNA adenine dimethylase